MKKPRYNDLKDMVYRMQLRNDESIHILSLKYIPSKSTGYSLNPGMYGITDINTFLEQFSPKNVKVRIRI